MTEARQLVRFVDAQDGVYASVVEELRRGRKTGHWIWYIFPQIAGLGFSPTSRKYSISGIEEAQAYLRHPLLGRRLRECTQLVLAIDGKTIEQIFGYPDNLKFRSCMTLFSRAAEDNQEFVDALEKYFGGEIDQLTIEKLGS